MAKYEITHTCGCVETVQIYGTNVHGEREKRAAWLASKPCVECQAKQAVAKDAEAGLPELTGSPKQIAWASDIREKQLKELDMSKAKIVPRVRKEYVEMVVDIFNEMRNEIAANTSAKYVIEHRDRNLKSAFYDKLQARVKG